MKCSYCELKGTEAHVPGAGHCTCPPKITFDRFNEWCGVAFLSTAVFGGFMFSIFFFGNAIDAIQRKIIADPVGYSSAGHVISGNVMLLGKGQSIVYANNSHVPSMCTYDFESIGDMEAYINICEAMLPKVLPEIQPPYKRCHRERDVFSEDCV